MSQHFALYEKFSDFLEVKRAEGDDGTDIREKLLSLRGQDIRVGYVEGNLTMGYGANLHRVFPHVHSLEDQRFVKARTYFASGVMFETPDASHMGSMRLLQDFDGSKELFLFEQGFLASTHSWSHSMREKSPDFACLSFVFDDMAHYYMADYPNRLIHRLNSDVELSEAETERARALIDRIVEQRISKYNAQPMAAPTMTEGYTRRVLVCDQSYADASTVYGKIDDAGYEAMLLAAIQENPDAEILVKSHPDTFWESGKRSGYFSHLKDTGRVRILRAPCNPYSLFELVDTVYVGTSQMGLEALFAGKKVVCFGAPFYAGWGLTDDRQKMPHRHRTRTLEDVFHTFYDWYSIYTVPGVDGPATIEDALDFIEARRPVSLPPPADEDAPPPKISVVLPVYGVEQFIEQCLSSIQEQTLKDIEIITVNDCSPDGSQEIIDRLAAEDPRIKPIILQKNAGQGFARNAGIDAARGEYVWFLDSDDFLARPDHLEAVYKMAEENGSDMVRARKLFERLEHADGQFKGRRRDETERFFNKEIPSTTFADHLEILHNRHFWTWLYRRDFLDKNNIRFTNGQWEERPFLLKAWLASNKISMSLSECAVYRVRPSSTARRAKTDKDLYWQLQNFFEVMRLLKAADAFAPDSPYRQHALFTLSQYMHHLFFGFAFGLVSSGAVETTFEQYCEQIAKEVDDVDVRPSELRTDPLYLSDDHKKAGAYPLILASLRARRFKFIRRAVSLDAFKQSEVYAIWAKAPESQAEKDFQSALNTYCRNDLIRTGPVTGPVRDKPRIIFHIGASKTGSTYLQHLMEANRPELLRQGIWYPEKGLFWQENRPHKQAGHAQATRAAVTGDKSLKDFILAGLKHHKGKIHTIVFSSEAFFLNERAQELANYFSDFDASVVLYIRRQDEWANSQYAEFVSGGAVGRVDVPIEEWLKRDNVRRLMDYRTTLERWCPIVGQDALSVRIYDRSEFPDGDLVADFAAVTNLPQLLKLEQPDSRMANDVQLSTPHVRALRLFNGMEFPSRENYFDFIQKITDAISAWREAHGKNMPKPNLLSQVARRRILDALAESNAEIAKTYFPDRKGPIFSEDLPVLDKAENVLAVEELEILWTNYKKFGGPVKKAAAAPAVTKKAEPAEPQKSVIKIAPAKLDQAGRAKLPATAYPVRSKKFVMGFALLQFSDLFDAKWYKATYPDVRQSRIPAVMHYLTAGCAEGRNPGPQFDTKRYYLNNPDVLDARENALVHFLRFGRKEGRR